MSLDRLALMVKQLIFLRAAELARQRRRTRFTYFRYGRDLRRPHLMRAAYGSRLRRALKRRGVVQRIAALMHALRNIDAYATPLAKRLKRRLTRLHAHRFAPVRESCVLLAAPAPFATDSS